MMVMGIHTGVHSGNSSNDACYGDSWISSKCATRLEVKQETAMDKLM
jgi:hypothetical protein